MLEYTERNVAVEDGAEEGVARALKYGASGANVANMYHFRFAMPVPPRHQTVAGHSSQGEGHTLYNVKLVHRFSTLFLCGATVLRALALQE